jgi:hypothetical protein
MPAYEKTQRVMRRIGVWTPGQQCIGRFRQTIARGVYRCKCGESFVGVTSDAPDHHLTPCPDPSDPAMIVAMLKWLVRRVNSVRFGNRDGRWTCAILRQYRSRHDVSNEAALHAALIDAIDALPED